MRGLIAKCVSKPGGRVPGECAVVDRDGANARVDRTVIDCRVPHKRTVADLHGFRVAVDGPTSVRAVAHEGTAADRDRAAVGIQRPAPVDAGVLGEGAVEDGERAGKGIGDRAAAKVGKVARELALGNIGGTFHADEDRAAGFIGLVERGGPVVLEADAGDGGIQVHQHRAAGTGESVFDCQIRDVE